MAAKRPSIAQIAARQKRLVRFQHSIGYSIGGLADEFNVQKKDINRFLSFDQKAIRRAYNRSPRLRSLFEQIGAPVNNVVKGEKLIPVVTTPKQRERLRERIDRKPLPIERIRTIYETSNEVEAYSYGIVDEELAAKERWADWAEQNGWSSSMAINRQWYNEGYINDEDWADLIAQLHEIYKGRTK